MSEKKLKEIIFSNELNQRITSAMYDEDFPNDGSETASLVQEEIYIQLVKDGIVQSETPKQIEL